MDKRGQQRRVLRCPGLHKQTAAALAPMNSRSVKHQDLHRTIRLRSSDTALCCAQTLPNAGRACFDAGAKCNALQHTPSAAVALPLTASRLQGGVSKCCRCMAPNLFVGLRRQCQSISTDLACAPARKDASAQCKACTALAACAPTAKFAPERQLQAGMCMHLLSIGCMAVRSQTQTAGHCLQWHEINLTAATPFYAPCDWRARKQST